MIFFYITSTIFTIEIHVFEIERNDNSLVVIYEIYDRKNEQKKKHNKFIYNIFRHNFEHIVIVYEIYFHKIEQNYIHS